ncbi:hypothetical protein F4861DRAFT_292079 [Xylaria intraflava]|nr:hypothetical protein F4861DRAFT_292079 [Xylaria intraflava]
MPETLREKASRKIKGPDANPSQLGDPISIKAETSDNVPTAEEAGAQSPPSSFPPPTNSEGTGAETSSGKVVNKLDSSDSSTSLPRDPASPNKETNFGATTNSEQAMPGNKIAKRDSKL